MNLSPETIRFINEHRSDDVRSLALQAKKYPGIDLSAAIIQIAGQQTAAAKIPSWQTVDGLLYPRHLSMEQCSSEATARYKAALVEGVTLTDLTGGFGIDCAFLSEKFVKTSYVERQKELCEIATHNFPLLGLNHIEVRNTDATAYLKTMNRVDCIFIDPARRNEHGGKTVAISDCEPDVAALEELLLRKANRVMVKLSPMLDLTLALRDLKQVQEVHIVSVGNECKELLLILSNEAVLSVAIHCSNLVNTEMQTFSFTREQEQTAVCRYTDEVETYLYEPNASILKAGAFRSIASVYNLKKLHPNSHLYTSTHPVENFPGRSFRVISTCSFNKKEIKESLSGLQKANITVRNFPDSVAGLRKRTKLSEGGDDYLFATTLNDGRKVLIRCGK